MTYGAHGGRAADDHARRYSSSTYSVPGYCRKGREGFRKRMASLPAPQEAVAWYIDEIDLAVQSIHDVVQRESGRIHSLLAQQSRTDARIVKKGERYQFLALNPDLDDEGLGPAARWELHFDDLPESDRIAADLEEARERFQAAAFSVSVLCGALLQVAKQAISVAEKGRPTAFRGRRIHGLPVGEVVWETRNQSVHFEEGAWSDGVKRVFEALDRAHPGKFVLSPGVNHAHRYSMSCSGTTSNASERICER